MPTRTRSRKRLPANYPSIPDAQSGPTRYNEPEVSSALDRVPAIRFEYGLTKADLRMQIEDVLLRRCPLPAGTTTALNDDVRSLLIEMLEDEAIRSHDAMFHRLISLIGRLKIKRAVAALVDTLKDRSTSALTKAYAANALGRIGETAASDALVAVSSTKDAMVRRQIAMALGRINSESVIAHLIRFERDDSVAVSEVATEALRRWEEQLGSKLRAGGGKRQKAGRRKGKILPAEER